MRKWIAIDAMGLKKAKPIMFMNIAVTTMGLKGEATPQK